MGGLGALTGQLGEVWSYSWRITASSWALFAAILTTYFVALQWLPTFLIGAGYARESAFIQSAGMAAVAVRPIDANIDSAASVRFFTIGAPRGAQEASVASSAG